MHVDNPREILATSAVGMSPACQRRRQRQTNFRGGSASTSQAGEGVAGTAQHSTAQHSTAQHRRDPVDPTCVRDSSAAGTCQLGTWCVPGGPSPAKAIDPEKKSQQKISFLKKKQKTIQEPHSTRDVIHLPFAVPRPRLLFLTHFKGTCGAT